MLSNEQDGTNWAAYGRTFSANHYSPLKQINDQNVSRLGLRWYYDIPPVVSVIAPPLAVDGVLYFATGYSVIHAMDARTGKLLWQYDPEVYNSTRAFTMRVSWGIRGITYYEGKVYTGTSDGRLIAIDARSGKVVWSVQTTQPNDGRYITGAPWAFKNTVVIGHGGADFLPTRGYVTAYDAKTGKQRWRFYTVPGNPADGFEDEAMKMAAKTWTGEWWKYGGGGTVWNAMAYDPKYNRLYLGTGNGQPHNQKVRSPDGGDNLFLSSIVALDADTGKYQWHYQTNPGETWDYNAAMDIALADLTIDGQRHSVLMQAPKNGFFYVIDRATGKLISAEKFAKVNWAESIDLKTGRPIENPNARYPDGKPFTMYPASRGAHGIQSMSFNPLTGLVYIPTFEWSTTFIDLPGGAKDWKNWKLNLDWVFNPGHGRPPAAARESPTTGLLAWNPVTQRAAWSKSRKGEFHGGTMTTAGNLVFQGTAGGDFIAYGADSGKELWTFDAQAGIASQPITYTVGGQQYVTLIVGYRGYGGTSGHTPEWDYYTQPRRVLTFALGATTKLPPKNLVARDFVDDESFAIDTARVEKGALTYAQHCLFCHGPQAESGGTAPDLRKSGVPLDFAAIDAVVREGALQARGMPKFAEFTEEQVKDLQHFIRTRARAAIQLQKSGDSVNNHHSEGP